MQSRVFIYIFLVISTESPGVYYLLGFIYVDVAHFLPDVELVLLNGTANITQVELLTVNFWINVGVLFADLDYLASNINLALLVVCGLDKEENC